jgi:polyhydroxybutyrate depolymerase
VSIVALASCSSDDADDSAQAEPATSATTATTAGPGEGDAVPSPGCGASDAGAVDEERRTLTVAGAERLYLLTVPPAHDGRTPLPLLLDFHGLAEGAEVHTQMSRFGDLARQEGFVVAFPHGQGDPVGWNVNAPPPPNADLQFVDQLLETLERDLCIDTSRVYAAGLSFGAIMSSFLACQRADTFAAVAPVAGITRSEDCSPARPVPVVAFHGTEDPILLFNGGVGEIPGITGQAEPGGTTTTTPPADLDGPGYPATVADWADANGCDPEPTDTTVSDDVLHRVYDCPEGQDVEFYILTGGGHVWPGSEFSRSIEQIVGYTTFDIDATEIAWEFFERFQLPADGT